MYMVDQITTTAVHQLSQIVPVIPELVLFFYFIRLSECRPSSTEKNKRFLYPIEQPSKRHRQEPIGYYGQGNYYAYQLSMQRGKFRTQVLPLELCCRQGQQC